MPTELSASHDLHHHGDTEIRDAELGQGLTDLAVNVRLGARPDWLTSCLTEAMQSLTRYPDATKARAAVARRHNRDPAEVLPTAGAAEAFVLLARTFRPKHAVVVHPQFTEPEAALRAAGHRVERVLLRAADGFRLDPDLIPDSADLVVIGNPTNPTSVGHPKALLEQLVRPGRCLVVDEAFADCVPDEPDSLADRGELGGVLVLRSLTKTWGLAGLRVGYVLAERESIQALASAQPLWPVSAPALAAMEACSRPVATAQARAWAVELVLARSRLVDGLRSAGFIVPSDSVASFVLAYRPGAADLRSRLRSRGWVVRRGDSFPGLDGDWLRIAVRDQPVTDAFLAVLQEELR